MNTQTNRFFASEPLPQTLVPACYRVVRGVTLAAIFYGSALLPAAAIAQPFTPTSNDQVVDTLPVALAALSADIRRAQALRSPSDTISDDQILQQALDAYQVAVASGEARAYGRTLSILQSWPRDIVRPAMYHILLAAVLQHNHNFTTALAQLQQVTSAQVDSSGPLYTQALMIQSQIGLVTGDHELVAQSCQALRGAARQAVSVNCQAQLDGVTGNARHALSRLTQVLGTGANLNTVDYLELMTTAAVVAHRLGDPSTAESYYQAALRLAPTHAYLIVNYSTLLLELGRPAAVIALLLADAQNTPNAEMNILLARALRATGADSDRARAADIVTSLEQEFELAFRRNEAIPHKEVAQFALALNDQPDAALRSAKANWSLQKAPSDALLLAQAAAANHDLDALDDIRRWQAATGLEDVRLQATLDSFREPSR
ncbi:MAG: hypothetical protein CMQ34_00560 [Gammaproteobacteria bacterium]|nr:hypothetical protein [Gammaproteobacteria bacterium]|tara:strand:+ start:93 stop:1388 length:1296 start_codon:yes stop_codon:yes gene_type:complete